MTSKLFVSSIVFLAGIFVGWSADSKGIDRVFAAEMSYSVHELSQLETPGSTARQGKGLLHFVVQGKSPIPGGPVAPQVTPQILPRAAMPPKVRAETSLPRELLQAQQLNRAPTPLQAFPDTPDGRLGKIRLFSQTNALPPPAATPPELQMLGQITSRSKAPPKPRPSIAELLNRLASLPGGKEAIQEAKRRGAQLSMQAPHSERSLLSSLSSLFGSREADAAQDFSVTFTPREPKNSLLSYIGIWLWASYVPQLDPGIQLGGGPTGWAMFQVDVPRDGMYLINIEAFSMSAKARLETAGTTLIGSWDFPGTMATLSFPTLVELAAGHHNFVWKLERGLAEFQEVSISSL